MIQRNLSLAVLLFLPLVQAQPRPDFLGPRDRFWRHHVTKESLIVDGTDHYHAIKDCLQNALTDEDRLLLQEVPTNRTIGKRLQDDPRLHEERWGKVILVEVKNAMTPAMVKAVRALSSCVKTNIPKFHEVRPMYQEYNLPNDDSNLGGNTPTHLLPFLGIYLPEVTTDILKTVSFAYDAAGWKALTVRDEILGQFEEMRSQSFPEPKNLGFRASEHLSYADFPLLEAHHDGLDTAYTVNFAFSGPDDYQGGYFYIIDDAGQKTFLKPEKYSCIVLLGGSYMHGVTQITGGHREMFSNEMWFNPDLPLGSTLWTSNGKNMQDYIDKCNQEEDERAAKENRKPNYGAHECTVKFSDTTIHGVKMDQVRNKYSEDGDEYSYPGVSTGLHLDSEDDEEEDEEEEDDYGSGSGSDSEDFDEEIERRRRRYREARRRKIQQQKQQQERLEDDFSFFASPRERYRDAKEQPNFLIPKELEPGQLAPLYFRDTEERLQDEEAFVVGLPPELLQEFNKYLENNGMLETAKKIAYETERSRKEHEVVTLKDGRKWGIMHPKWGGNDMVWIDPGDEECFESLMDVLRKGNFDVILEAIGEFFELDGLMVQGIGPIFLSHFEHDPEYKQIHHDLIEAKGAFYNVVVPLYIPEDGASLYVGDSERSETIQMAYNVGTLLGAGTLHGTGEADYRAKKDVRLSVAIYVADVNDRNVEIVASDSTSLWPTEGDVHWFKAQEGRLWLRGDPIRSLKNDQGRQPINVQDERKDCQEQPKELCESDPAGFRLECPRTCRVYLDDDEYYKQLRAMVNNESQSQPAPEDAAATPAATEPTCNTPAGMEPTCGEPAAVEE